MIRKSLPFVALVLLTLAVSAHGNPIPSPYLPDLALQPGGARRWLLLTAPFNYLVDLAALTLALWSMGQMRRVKWFMMPLYNLPIFVAGYTADYLAAIFSQYAIRVFYEGAPADVYLYSDAVLPAVAAALIFLMDAAMLWLIVRWIRADSRPSVRLGAAILAILTAPYYTLIGDRSFLPWLAPAIVIGAGAAISIWVRGLETLIARKKKTQA